MKKTLIVVDMQNDFITGPLGTPEAMAILPKVKEKIEEYRRHKDTIIFTKDTHSVNYLETNEGKHLPVTHCIARTHGWDIVDGLVERGDEIQNKFTFGYNHWEFYEDVLTNDVEIIGVCTDVCVVSNALILKTLYPEINFTVDASCCAGTTPENHRASLQVMRSCQIDVVGDIA